MMVTMDRKNRKIQTGRGKKDTRKAWWQSDRREFLEGFSVRVLVERRREVEEEESNLLFLFLLTRERWREEPSKEQLECMRRQLLKECERSGRTKGKGDTRKKDGKRRKRGVRKRRRKRSVMKGRRKGERKMLGFQQNNCMQSIRNSPSRGPSSSQLFSLPCFILLIFLSREAFLLFPFPFLSSGCQESARDRSAVFCDWMNRKETKRHKPQRKRRASFHTRQQHAQSINMRGGRAFPSLTSFCFFL